MPKTDSTKQDKSVPSFNRLHLQRVLVLCSTLLCLLGIYSMLHRGAIDYILLSIFIILAICGLISYMLYVFGYTEATQTRAAKEQLQEKVAQQESQMADKTQEMLEMQRGIILGMATLVERRDHSTGDHIRRTSEFADLLASTLLQRGLYADEIDERFISILRQVTPLHDLGKIRIPDSILNKPEKLTEEEMSIMKIHTQTGGELICQVMQDITDPYTVQMAFDVSTFHHEQWDGKGYPFGIAGTNIPLSARIVAIADVFEALTAVRVYKKAYTPDEAFAAIAAGRGTRFDPDITDVFLSLKPEVTAFLALINGEYNKLDMD